MGVERERHEAIPRGIGPHFILLEPDFLLARFKTLFNGPEPAGHLDERAQRDPARREDDVVRAVARDEMPAHEQGVLALRADARERHDGPAAGPSYTRGPLLPAPALRRSHAGARPAAKARASMPCAQRGFVRNASVSGIPAS